MEDLGKERGKFEWEGKKTRKKKRKAENKRMRIFNSETITK